MLTHFTPAQLADPALAEANGILRTCVHCGFCTATCPTYVLLGDELDSPRGRIMLIKDMLENNKPATEAVVTHIDRCLSCLACMTTCPSGVNYMHLIDHARTHIERTYVRPWLDRVLRDVLAWTLPHPVRFRLAVIAAWAARPLAGLLPRRLRAMIAVAPRRLPSPSPWDRPQVFSSVGVRRKRVALLTGCAQRALNTNINDATIRLLTRHGVEVVVVEGAGCCGALTLHMGKSEAGRASAAANIRAWTQEIDGAGLDAIVINTSGCGTTVKEYGHMFQGDGTLAKDAARISALTKDICELMGELTGDLTGELRLGAVWGAAPAKNLRVAYHAACSLQHGQKVTTQPQALLRAAGFRVVEPAEGHLCCGSAGTYNLLEPEIATELGARKAANIARTHPDVIAAGNIGCMMQIGAAMDVPVVHTVELLDWATGGPKPPGL